MVRIYKVKCCNLTVDDIRAKRYAKKLSSKDKEKILELHDMGVTPKEIAEVIGVPTKRIHIAFYHLRSQRQLEMPQSRPAEKYLIAKEMWDNGSTIQQIANEYGYSFKKMYGVIEWYRKKFGWFPNRKFKKAK